MVAPYYDDKGITLYHGDCLAVMAGLADRSFDAVICDPPYGTTACSWDTVIPFAPMWAQLMRLIRPRGAIVLFGSQPFTSALVMSNPGWYRHSWVWDKRRATGGANAEIAPMKAHEDVIIFGKHGVTYIPQMGLWEDITRSRKRSAFRKKTESFSHADHYSPGREEQLRRGRYPDTVLRIPALGSIDPERTAHPTQKPLALLEYLVKTYTQEGDVILDFTAGSGTTLRAAKNLKRRAIGIELLEPYCAVTVARLAPRFEDAIPAPACADYGPLFEGL